MDKRSSIALAGMMALLVPAAATAADLRPPIVPMPPPPVAAPVAEQSGWYLRGDIGIGVLDAKPEIVDLRFNPPSVAGHDKTFGNPLLVGIGAGYQFNSWLRADVTAEFRGNAAFKFTDKYCFGNVGPTNIAIVGAGCASTAGFTGSDGRNLYNGQLSTQLYLANGYVDLGTWNGLTPYVGLGVGFASHRVSGLTDQGSARNFVGGAEIASSVATPVNFGTKTQTNFAWAVMAGVGYDVTQNLKLELGYRYVNMGGIKGIRPQCPNATCGSIEIKNVDSHDFRLGMRWLLGGPSYAAAAPMPVAYPHEPRVMKRF